MGDVGYLEVTTPQDGRVQVTCSAAGLHVNRCTPGVFSPDKAVGSKTYTNLLDLMLEACPKFARTWVRAVDGVVRREKVMGKGEGMGERERTIKLLMAAYGPNGFKEEGVKVS
jgi:hypothetical protein